MAGIAEAIDQNVKPLSKRGDRKFLELTGSAKDGFSQASRVPDVVSAGNVQAAAAAAEAEKQHTKRKKEVSKHLKEIMKEKEAQHKLHAEHQQVAMDMALQFAATDKEFATNVAEYAHKLGIVRAETKAAVQGFDSRMQLEMDAIGF